MNDAEKVTGMDLLRTLNAITEVLLTRSDNWREALRELNGVIERLSDAPASVPQAAMSEAEYKAHREFLQNSVLVGGDPTAEIAALDLRYREDARRVAKSLGLTLEVEGAE